MDAKKKAKANLKTQTASLPFSDAVTKAVNEKQYIYAEGLIFEALTVNHVTQEEANQMLAIIADLKALETQLEKSNPLSGKGKSYADRVEGPNGWGQYIPVTRNDDDDFDILF